jgi:hypothetical protein
MPKRFTDTDKWKKPFIRGLEGPYKLFWFYLLDDCDHAGIWQVDFEVAQIRIGETLIQSKAIALFGDRIEIFDHNTKWFLKDFIFFQYGELTPKNRLHVSVINILTKLNVGPYKVLTRAQGQGTIQGQGYGQGKEASQTKLEIFAGLFSDELFIEQLAITHKGKNIEKAFDECYIHHANAPNPPTELGEWRQKLNTWLINTKSNANLKTNPRRADATIETADFGNL